SALGDESDRGRARVTCARSAGFDAELLHCIEARLYTLKPAAEAVDQRDAVLQDLGRPHLEAIRSGRRAAFDARRQVEQSANVAPVQWQLVNLKLVLDV